MTEVLTWVFGSMHTSQGTWPGSVHGLRMADGVNGSVSGAHTTGSLFCPETLL